MADNNTILPRHPIQPLVEDEHGVVRFKANAIVRYLLDCGPADMNTLASLPFSREDREQFAQLIGYSLCGFAELDYASEETCSAAGLMKDRGFDEKDARIASLESVVEKVRAGLREIVPEVFRIHPDDLEA